PDVYRPLNIHKAPAFVALLKKYPEPQIGLATIDDVKLMKESTETERKKFIVSYPVWMNAQKNHLIGKVNAEYGFNADGSALPVKLLNITLYPKPILPTPKSKQKTSRKIDKPEHAVSGLSESIVHLPKKSEPLPYGVTPAPGVSEAAESH